MTTEKKLQLYRDVAKYNGTQYQMTVATEELAQLTQAITKWLRGGSDIVHIAEEIADVTIAMECIEEILQLEKVVSIYKRHKLERLEYKYLNSIPT